MLDTLKRFAAYYRPHRGLFALDFSSAVAACVRPSAQMRKALFRRFAISGDLTTCFPALSSWNSTRTAI